MRKQKVDKGESRPPLSRSQVVQTALSLIDQGGFEAFSMRKLGAALRVDPMAVYYYFPNKEAVLDGIVEAVLAESNREIDPSLNWEEQCQDLMREYRRVLKAHPKALPIIATRPVISPQGLKLMDRSISIIKQGGFSARSALEFLSIISPFIIGFVLAEVGTPPGGLPDLERSELERIFTSLTPEEYPNLTEAIDEQIFFDADSQFETGLKAFFTGLQTRLLKREGPEKY